LTINVKAREPTWRAISREAPPADVVRREVFFEDGLGVEEDAIWNWHQMKEMSSVVDRSSFGIAN